MERCPHLQSIGLGLCAQVDGEVLCLTVESFPRLQVLDISGCPRANDTVLAALSQHCPALSTLRVARCTGITAAGLCSVASLCRSIEVLDLRGNAQFGDVNTAPLFQSLAALREVDLSDTDVGEATVLALAHSCHALRIAKFSNCANITAQSVQKLTRRCILLRELFLFGCRRFTERDIQGFVTAGSRGLVVHT